MSSFIEMPKLSDTMTEGTVVKWRKAVGDTVQTGDVLAEIETDKAVMELEAFDEGTLSEIYVPGGGKAVIGQKLARLASSSGNSQPESHDVAAAASGLVAVAHTTYPASKPETAPAKPTAKPSGVRLKASPLAKKLAAERGVDLALLQGSGPGGRVVARDIEVHSPATPTGTSAEPLATVSPLGPGRPPAELQPGDKRVPLSGMRKVIAERLLASKTQIPHFYLNLEADVTELTGLRAQVNAALEKGGLGKFTINDFIVRAAVIAATRVPRVNASFAGDAVIEHANVHLAVAVAMDEGLVTPVIREAQKKSLREISEAIKDLANRARNKKLKPEEYQGGTMTVSNLGSYGIESFSAIINPPQAIILAIGAIVKKPVVNPAGQVVAGERMSIGLSADHRVVDGAMGAQYLAQLRELLENPTLLLI